MTVLEDKLKEIELRISMIEQELQILKKMRQDVAIEIKKEKNG